MQTQRPLILAAVSADREDVLSVSDSFGHELNRSASRRLMTVELLLVRQPGIRQLNGELLSALCELVLHVVVAELNGVSSDIHKRDGDGHRRIAMLDLADFLDLEKQITLCDRPIVSAVRTAIASSRISRAWRIELLALCDAETRHVRVRDNAVDVRCPSDRRRQRQIGEPRRRRDLPHFPVSGDL
jgi:hypothetical protein